MTDIKVDSQKIVIEKNKGITHALKKQIEKMPNSILSDGNISKEEWYATMDKLAELNQKRIENGQKPIFKGNTDKTKNGWHNSFIVDENQEIELSAEEMQELYKTMGVTIKSSEDTPQETEKEIPSDKPEEKTVTSDNDEAPIQEKKQDIIPVQQKEQDTGFPKPKEVQNQQDRQEPIKQKPLREITPATENKTEQKPEINISKDKKDESNWKKIGLGILITVGTILSGGKILKSLKKFPKIKIKKPNIKPTSAIKIPKKTYTKPDIKITSKQPIVEPQPKVKTKIKNIEPKVEQKPKVESKPKTEPQSKITPKVPMVNTINENEINFSSTCCGFKGYKGNSKEIGFNTHDMRHALVGATYGTYKDVAVFYDRGKKSSVIVLNLQQAKKLGIHVENPSMVRPTDNITIFIDGMISQQKANKFISALNGKLSVNSRGELIINKKDIVNTFNSI